MLSYDGTSVAAQLNFDLRASYYQLEAFHSGIKMSYQQLGWPELLNETIEFLFETDPFSLRSDLRGQKTPTDSSKSEQPDRTRDQPLRTCI